MSIRILPPHVANQIAAGEIVERPVSVVKELVENALDAGADTVIVEVLGGGRRLIRVSDNGAGIPSEDAPLAFERHATSKLADIEDLDHIRTLGFRGEALASIASVSRMTMLTRHTGESHGTRLYLEAGQVLQQETAGAPVGTVITVENLFYNVPARLKFMKQDSTERAQVGALVSRYAMAYPAVRFKLLAENKETLHTAGSDSLQTVLNEVYGLEVAAQMLEVNPFSESHRDDLLGVAVRGFIGVPALNRANRNQITLFVNGRWVQDASLSYAVVQAYHTMLMTGRYPVAVLLINLPPEDLDVNVHPTKAQVRFRNPNAVFSALQKAVRRTLVEQAPTPALRSEIVWGSPEWAARRERLTQVTGERLSQLGMDIDLDDPGDYRHQQAGPDDIGEDRPAPVKRRVLPMLRVIGQVGGTYIVAEGPGGVYLIDQHAAHERVLFEKFMKEEARSDQPPASQEMLETLIVDLLPDQYEVVAGNLDLLRGVGFAVEPFGRNTLRLSAVPAMVAGGDPVEALLAAMGEIECGEMPLEATAEERLIARVCKQAAVKAGQVLSHAEMQALVRGLEDCEAPKTCPHGRPTMLHLSADQLAKEFGRMGAI